MKSVLRSLMLVAGLLASVAAWSQLTLPPSGNNQRSEVTQYLGLVKVTITYNSPDVAGREIWGKLVPYGLSNLNFLKSTEQNPSPWRAGSNEITTISFSHDVQIDGKPLKAGTYGLHMIPGQEDWTVIFSNNSTSWGSFSYVQSDDALRVNVKSAPAEFNEWLTYEFSDRLQNSATAALKWEKIAIPFKIAVPNGDDLYLQRIRADMTSNRGFNWLAAVGAVNQFLVPKKLALDEGEAWMQGFIDRNVKYFPIYNAKANAQAAAGKQAEADATMKEAIALPDATAGQIMNYGRQLIRQKREKEAMAVMEGNNKRFPNNSAALVGMAYAYDANGDKKNALKFAQNALKFETTPQGKTQIEGLIKKLQAGESINT
jgi:tetratricopeptide (TPR) repeat protein